MAEPIQQLQLVAAATDDGRFNWDSSNRDVIVTSQRELAIYTNHFGQVVIRVGKDWPDESDDPFICIDHAHLPKVIKRLQEIAAAPLNRSEPE